VALAQVSDRCCWTSDSHHLINGIKHMRAEFTPGGVRGGIG
jgi:hypothetical protein